MFTALESSPERVIVDQMSSTRSDLVIDLATELRKVKLVGDLLKSS